MDEHAFAALTGKAQVSRLRHVALAALQQYGLEVGRLRLLSHGFNTIFRVDTGTGQKYALRLNVNSRRTLANVRAEMAWLHALARETDLRVATPVPTREGHLVGVIEHENAPKATPFALFEWLPGPLLDEKCSSATVEQLGAAMATLHGHARAFSLPAGCELPDAAHVMYDSPRVLFEAPHEHVTADRLEVFKAAFEIAQGQHDRAWAAGPARVIHSDLHQWNLKLHRGQLSIFDFDDCLLGHPAQDVATSLYYLERQRPDPEFREALERGYTRVAPWPVVDAAQLEGLLASRALLLANDVLGNLNPDIRKVVPSFMERAERNLRHLLEHGTFGATA